MAKVVTIMVGWRLSPHWKITKTANLSSILMWHGLVLMPSMVVVIGVTNLLGAGCVAAALATIISTRASQIGTMEVKTVP